MNRNYQIDTITKGMKYNRWLEQRAWRFLRYKQKHKKPHPEVIRILANMTFTPLDNKGERTKFHENDLLKL